MKVKSIFYRILSLALILFLLFIMYNAIYGENEVSTYSPLVGKTAPGFSLKTFDGKVISLSDMKGKAVLLNFWASWCNPCKEEADSLERTYRNLSGEEVEFLAVNVLDEQDSARKFLTLHGGSFPHVYDEDRNIHLDYGVEGVPETFFISPDGTITNKYKGPLTDDLISKFIEEALNYEQEN